MIEDNEPEPVILISGDELNITEIGARDTNQMIKETIDSAGRPDLYKNEDSWLHMAGYVFTKNFAARDNLIGCLERGTNTIVVINRLLKKHIPDGKKDNNTGRDFLLELNRNFTNMKLYSFKSEHGNGELHAKTIIANRNRAIIGSANFSVGGTDKNYELGLQVIGQTAYDLATIVDSIANNSNLCTLITEKNESE